MEALSQAVPQIINQGNLQYIKTLVEQYPDLIWPILQKENVLQKVSFQDNASALHFLLQLYPSHERLPVLLTVNCEGKTLRNELFFYRAEAAIDRIEVILSLLPDTDKLTFINPSDGNDESLLLIVSSNCPVLCKLLELYPEDQRLAAIKACNASGLSLLGSAAIQGISKEVIFTLLSLYPETERLAAVISAVANNNRRSVLEYVAAKQQHPNSEINYPALITLLNLLPAADRVAAVKLLLSYGHYTQTLLHYLLDEGEAEHVATILALLPPEERLSVMQCDADVADGKKGIEALALRARIVDQWRPVYAVLAEKKSSYLLEKILEQLPGGKLLLKAFNQNRQLYSWHYVSLWFKDKQVRLITVSRCFQAETDLKELAGMFEDFNCPHSIFNTHSNILYDSLWGKTYTDSFLETWDKIRQDAYQKLMIQVQQLDDMPARIELLTWACQQSLFNKPRSNYFGAEVKTKTVQKIEATLEQLEQQTRLSIS